MAGTERILPLTDGREADGIARGWGEVGERGYHAFMGVGDREFRRMPDEVRPRHCVAYEPGVGCVTLRDPTDVPPARFVYVAGTDDIDEGMAMCWAANRVLAAAAGDGMRGARHARG